MVNLFTQILHDDVVKVCAPQYLYCIHLQHQMIEYLLKSYRKRITSMRSHFMLRKYHNKHLTKASFSQFYWIAEKARWICKSYFHWCARACVRACGCVYVCEFVMNNVLLKIHQQMDPVHLVFKYSGPKIDVRLWLSFSKTHKMSYYSSIHRNICRSWETTSEDAVQAQSGMELQMIMWATGQSKRPHMHLICIHDARTRKSNWSKIYYGTYLSRYQKPVALFPTY